MRARRVQKEARKEELEQDDGDSNSIAKMAKMILAMYKSRSRKGAGSIRSYSLFQLRADQSCDCVRLDKSTKFTFSSMLLDSLLIPCVSVFKLSSEVV